MNCLVRRLALLSALLSQLFFAVLAPAFVVCQEGNGDQSVELSLAGCCDGDADERGQADELRLSSDECGDCEDAVLSISLQREEVSRQLCLSLSASAFQSSYAWCNVCPSPQSAPRPSLELDAALALVGTVRLRC